MNIELVKMNGHDARLLKTDKYTIYLASFMFQTENTIRNRITADLLFEYMLNTNEKYKTPKEISLAFRENYGMDIGLSCFIVGKSLFMQLFIMLIDPRAVKEEYLEKAISFAHDIFFNLKQKEAKLDKKELKICKERMIDEVGAQLSFPALKAYRLFEKNVYGDESIHLLSHFDTKIEYAKYLNSIKDDELISLHSHLVNDYFVGCNLLGNYRKKDILLLKKNFPFKMHPLNKVKSNKISLDNVPKYIEYSDENLNSSYLSVVYKVKDYDTKEMETYNAINEVLNDVGYLLRKVLRDERQLVYYAYSSFLSKSGIFEINTNITKENEEATIEAIDEVFKRLEDPVLVEELLKIGKREVKRSNYVEDESYSKVFGRMIDEGFRFSKPKKISTRKYMALKKEDIAKALKKLEKVTVYIYRGEKQ